MFLFALNCCKYFHFCLFILWIVQVSVPALMEATTERYSADTLYPYTNIYIYKPMHIDTQQNMYTSVSVSHHYTLSHHIQKRRNSLTTNQPLLSSSSEISDNTAPVQHYHTTILILHRIGSADLELDADVF